jgi:ABC-type multidrug transport system fused ATPase/permease subunit
LNHFFLAHVISSILSENAAEDAQLDPLLQRLQGGWEGAVGPRGRLLSGGERQRVCLARALYREELNGGILLMDEVTASLDAKTEALVTNAVRNRVKKGATAVLIAHRLSSVQHCDQVLVMKDGEIIERGTHAQLIKRTGWYAESWKLQSETR